MGIRIGTLEGTSLKGIGEVPGRWVLVVNLSPIPPNTAIWKWDHPGWSKDGIQIKSRFYPKPPPPDGDVSLTPPAVIPVALPVVTSPVVTSPVVTSPVAKTGVFNFDTTTLLIIGGLIVLIYIIATKK